MTLRVQPLNSARRFFPRHALGLGRLCAVGLVTLASTIAGQALAETAPVPGLGQPSPGYIGLQTQVTPLGRQGEWLHNALLMPIIVTISVLVLGLLLWVIVRYRRGANPNPSRTSHNTLIEVIWTGVPILILLVIAFPSIRLVAAQYHKPGAEAVTIKAIGNQWYWTYQYPDHGDFEITANMLKEKGEKLADGERARTDADGPRLLAVDNRIVVPVGVPVRLQVTSNDVIHSWAVPAFWTKMDGVPGRINEISFTVDKPGVYFGQCSELCGARHAFMPIAVEVVSKEDFARWIVAKGGKMPGAAPALGDVNATQAAINERAGEPAAANANAGTAPLTPDPVSMGSVPANNP